MQLCENQSLNTPQKYTGNKLVTKRVKNRHIIPLM